MKKKREEAELALVVFFPKCRRKNPLRECPLDRIEVFGICSEDHATNNYPSLPRLTIFYQIVGELE